VLISGHIVLSGVVGGTAQCRKFCPGKVHSDLLF